MVNMTHRSVIVRSALAAVLAASCVAGPASAQSTQGYDPDTPVGQVMYASSQIIWPPLLGFINFLQADNDRNMMLSIYAASQGGLEVRGSFRELDRCAQGLKSSNPDTMARFFGAGVCLLVNPWIVDQYREEQRYFDTAYRLY